MTKTADTSKTVFTAEFIAEIKETGAEAVQFLMFDPQDEVFRTVTVAVEELLEGGLQALEDAANSDAEDLPGSFNDSLFDALGVLPKDMENNIAVVTLPGMKDLPDGNDWSTQAYDSDDVGTVAKGLALLGGAMIVGGVAVAVAGTVLTGGAGALPAAEVGAAMAAAGVKMMPAAAITARVAISMEQSEKNAKKEEEEKKKSTDDSSQLPQEGDPALDKISKEDAEEIIAKADPMNVDTLILTDGEDDSFVFITVDLDAETADVDHVILVDPEAQQYYALSADIVARFDPTYGLIDPDADGDAVDTVAPDVPEEQPIDTGGDAFLVG
ncbi:MAG: hypothetical protein AAGH68_05280 [Pseudomonadota bacterium]